MSVESILQQMAASAGNRLQRRADLWGGTIEGLSQIPGNLARDREQRAIFNEQRARQRAADQRGANQDAQQAKKDAEDQRQQDIAHRLMTVYTAGSPNDPSTNDLPGAIAEAKRLDAAEWIPKLQKLHTEEMLAAQPKITQTNPEHDLWENGVLKKPGVKPPKSMTPTDLAMLGMNANPVVSAFAKGALNLSRAPAVSVPTLGSPADAVTRYATEHGLDPKTMTTAQVNTALRQHTDATQKTPVAGGLGALYADIDPKAIAAQIRTGDHPPDLGQYGRPAAAAIASELARKGPNGEAPFKLAAAQREWKAQLKLNSTMNGPQQVRLDESIRSGLAMYDKVDELAKQWDGMGIGPLSRANLAAARDGLKGKQAASIANQLTGQIGQLTSDIATIEQGGLTPTNEARAVAEQSMQAWWGKGTILDMTAQGRYNMQIRHAARNTQEPMTPGNGVDRRPALPATPPATGNTYQLVNGQWVKQ